MRVKRQEYENLKTDVSILKDMMIQNNEKFRIMEINDILRDYGLYIYWDIVSSYWWKIKCWFVIYNNESNEVVKNLDTLSDFDKRFEWYKDGIENGDIVLECNCEEVKDKKVLNSKKK